MPELPEVETVVRSIRPLVSGKKIRSAVFRSRFVTQGDFNVAAESLAGSRIESVERTGKHIFIRLDRGLLHIHLGMTGKLLWNGSAGPYTRAVIELENGTLVYDDIRQFGRVNFYAQIPAHLMRLGPDALSLSVEEFLSGLRSHKTSIKAVLLNQQVLSGVGNIYADEALYAAGVHPKTRANRLSKARLGGLYSHLRRILENAIARGGSSISDYVDVDGRAGSFQLLHQVYGKEGLPCPTCGVSIKRMVVAQRGTHYCPNCQRR